MLYVEGNTIRMTRGDTAYLSVPLVGATEPYEMRSTDTLTFSVKRRLKDEAYILQKVITGTNTFHIEPSDTAGFSFGAYTYDVQLNTADGDVYTVIPPSTFELLTEVTC
jgi:hypothetical protein